MRVLASRIIVGVLLLFGFQAVAHIRAEDWPKADWSITGMVVDEAGKAIDKASVWLTTTEHMYYVAPLGHAHTNAEGRFTITVPERWFAGSAPMRDDLSLIAYKAGLHLAGLSLAKTSIPPKSGIRLTLVRPKETAIRVQTPDQKPVAGAKVVLQAIAIDKLQTGVTLEEARHLTSISRVEPRPIPLGFALGRGWVYLPDELAAALAVTTGADGQAILRGVTQNELARVSVFTDTHGQQALTLNLYNDAAPDNKIPQTFTLQPVSSLAGQIKADNPEAFRGIRLRIASQDKSVESMKTMQHGVAEVVPDAQGRFRVPALLVGSFHFDVFYPQDGVYRLLYQRSRSGSLKSGEQKEIEFSVVRAVRATGLVREKSSGKPIAGVQVHLRSDDGKRMEVSTDDTGRYRALIASRFVVASALPIPPYFLPPQPLPAMTLGSLIPPGALEVPSNVTDFELPVIELNRASSIWGTVVGEDGKPVAGAAVTATFHASNRQFGSRRAEKTALSDNRGAFRIDDAIFSSEVRVVARHEERLTERTERLLQSPDKPLTLRITKSGGIAFRGLVVDAAGKPMAGATIKLLQKPPARSIGQMPQDVPWPEGKALHTNERGEYQSPRLADTEATYQLTAEHLNYSAAKSDWILPKPGDTTPVANFVMHRVRTVEGRVLDRAGKPVADTVVVRMDDKKRIRTTSDANGRYRLQEISDSSGFLFVEKAGFRFHGQRHESTVDVLDVVLSRTSEAVSTTLPALGHVLSRKERVALAAQVLEPAVKEIMSGADQSQALHILELLAQCDPARVLELVDKKVLKKDRELDNLRRAVAKSLMARSSEESRIVIDAIQDHALRSTGYCDLADALPEEKRAEKKELLAQSLLHARRVVAPDLRLTHMCYVIQRLRECGEQEHADRLLRELLPEAKQLARVRLAGYARSRYAENWRCSTCRRRWSCSRSRPIAKRTLTTLATRPAGMLPFIQPRPSAFSA